MSEYLRGVQKRQQDEKAFLGAAYADSGYVCVGPDGAPLTPNAVSMHFRRMIGKAACPTFGSMGCVTALDGISRIFKDGWGTAIFPPLPISIPTFYTQQNRIWQIPLMQL